MVGNFLLVAALGRFLVVEDTIICIFIKTEVRCLSIFGCSIIVDVI